MRTATATDPSPSRPAPASDEGQRHGLRRFLRWLGADSWLADELAQEALLRLWRSPPAHGDDPAVAAAWLRTTARNLFRSAAARPRPGVPLDDAVLLEAAWRQFARNDAGDHRLAALAECLPLLPERARAALDLHYRHGQDHRALAAALGLRPAGIKRLLQRTRLLLADCIARRTNP